MSVLDQLIAEAKESGPTVTVNREVVAGDGEFVVKFPYDPTLVAAIGQVPGAHYEKKTREWVVPHSSAQYLLTFATQYGFAGSNVIDAAAAAAREAMQASAATDADVDVPGLGGELLPYQRAGIAYALNHRRVIFGDEMGLGKTIQALVTAYADGALDRGGILVVCPATLKRNWAREIGVWLPGNPSVSIVDGTKTGDYGADIVIINYDILGSHLDKLKERSRFGAVILDESHYLKNGKAQRTKNVAALVKGLPTDALVLALTGTAVINRPVELASQLRILGVLDQVFGGYWPFVKRYCAAFRTPFGWDMSGSSNLEELHERLRSACYVRRLKSDVLKDLPRKLRRRVLLEVPAADQRKYRDAEADVLGWLRDQARQAMDAAGDDPEARKVAYHQWLKANSNNAEHLRRIGTLRKLAAEAKSAAIIEWVEAFLEGSERKIVLFAHHVEIVDAYMEAFGQTAVRVSGNVSLDDRQIAVDRFQTDPNVRVFVGNIAAAGVGITLTAASDVGFAEQGWTPGEHDQAEDRCHRIGQEDNVTATYFLLPDSIDEEMADIIDAKRDVTDHVLDGGKRDDVELQEDAERSTQSALIDRLTQSALEGEDWIAAAARRRAEEAAQRDPAEQERFDAMDAQVRRLGGY